MAAPTSFPFQKLPIEIRFQIYPLVCDQREWTFCECRKHAKQLKADLAVLRTSNEIHDEALPIIYQNHTFQLLCTIPDPDSPKNRHPILGYKASILVCQNFDARSHVRKIAIGMSPRDSPILPSDWPRMEGHITEIYSGLRTITLRQNILGSVRMFDLTFDLTRRLKAASAETRVSNYKPVLTALRGQIFPLLATIFQASGARAQNQGVWMICRLARLEALEEFCDQVVTSHSEGVRKECAFTGFVQLVGKIQDHRASKNRSTRSV